MNLKNLVTKISLLLVLLTVLTVSNAFAQAKTIYVNNDIGLDGYNGLSATVTGNPGEGPKLTITNAIASAAAGDIISVASTGILYNETVAITKNLTFTSTGGTPSVKDFTLNVAGGASFTGAFNVTGTLYLLQGPLAGGDKLTIAGGTATGTYNIRRDAASTIDAAPAFGSSINIRYDLSTNMTIGPEFPASTSTYSNANILVNELTVSGANILTVNRNVQIKGVLTSTSQVALGTSTLTLYQNSANATSYTHSIGANLTSTAVGSGALEVYTYDGGNGAVTVNLNGAGNIPNLAITQGNGSGGHTVVVNGATTINGNVNIRMANVQFLTPTLITGSVTNVGNRRVTFIRGAGFTTCTINGSLSNTTGNGEIIVDNATNAGNFTLNVGGDIVNTPVQSHNSNSTLSSFLGVMTFGTQAMKTAGNLVTVNVTGSILNSPTLTVNYVSSSTQNTYVNGVNMSFFGPVTVGGNVTNSPSVAGSNSYNVANSGITNAANIYFSDDAVTVTGLVLNAPTSSFSSSTGAHFEMVGNILFANVATNVTMTGGLKNTSTGFASYTNNGRVAFTARAAGTITLGADLTNESTSSVSNNGDVNLTGTGAITINGMVRLEGASGNGDILFGSGNLTVNGINITRASSNANVTVADGAGALSLGTISVTSSAKLIARTQTGSIGFGSLTLTAGTIDFGGVSTANITGAANANVTITGGRFELGTGVRTFTVQGASCDFSGATFGDGASTTLVFNRTISGQTLTSQSGRVWPGNLQVSNTFPVSPTFTLTGGNLIVNGTVQFDAGGAANGVDLTTRNLYVKGASFTNNGGYTATGSPAGFVTMQGSAAQTVDGTASFYNIEVDNAAGVTFTEATAAARTYTITGTFNLTNGAVNTGAGPDVISLNNSTVYPTIVRNQGSFTGTPTFGSKVNVVYIGSTSMPFSNEVPTALNTLVNLTVATSGGNTVSAIAGQNFEMIGTLTVNAGQTLDIRDVTVTMKGASIVNNGNIVNTPVAGVNGSIIFAREGGTTVNGAGTLPSIVINNNSAANSITGVAGLVNGAATTVGDGNLTLNGGATSGVVTLAFTGDGPHLNDIAAGSGNTINLGASLLAKGSVNFGAATINLGANNLTFRGAANTITGGMTVSGTGKLVANNTTGASTITVASSPVTVGNLEVKTGAQTASIAGGSVVVSGDLTVTSGTLSVPLNQAVTVTGNNVNLSSVTSLGGAGTLVSNPTTGTLTVNLAGTTTIANLTVSNNTKITGSTSVGNLIITGTLKHDGGLFDFGSRNVNAQTAFTRTAGTYAATTGELQLGNPAGAAATVSQGTGFSIPNLALTASGAATVAAQSFTVTNKFKLAIGANTFTSKVGGTVRLNLPEGATVEMVSGAFDETPLYAGAINFVYGGTGDMVVTDKEWPVAQTVNALTVNLAANTDNLTFPTGIRTVGQTVTLTRGKLNLGANDRQLNLADGITVNRTGQGTVDLADAAGIGAAGAANGEGTLNYMGKVDINYVGTSAITTGAELSAAGSKLRNLTFTRTGDVANFVTTVGSAISVSGTLLIKNDVTTNATVTALGDITIANDNGDNPTSPVTTLNQALVFGGSANQVFTLNGNRTLGNITLNKSVSTAKVTITDGNILMTGSVTFQKGLLVTGTNYIKLQNAAGVANPGFVRNVASGDASHVVGNVRKDLRVGTISSLGRNDFPVGDELNYRPVAITSLNSTNANLGVDVTVNHVNQQPTGIVGLPISNGITQGVDIAKYPNFYWTISSTASLGATVFDLELTAAGFTGFDNISNARIIRRIGTPIDVTNEWSLQGVSYDNFLSAGVPVVVNKNSQSGIRPEGAVFTYGLATNLKFAVPFTAQTLTENGLPYAKALAGVVTGNTGTLTYSASSTNATVAVASISNDSLYVYPKAQGSTTVSVRATDADGSFITTNFSVTVTPVTVFAVSGKVAYDNTAATALSGVTVTLTGAKTYTATTNASGDYSVANVDNGAYTVTAASAAVWPTTAVTSSDAMAAAQYLVDPVKYPLTDLKKAAADVNNDGKVNSTDALLIMRRIVRLDSTFAKGDWTFASKSITVSGSQVTGADLKGLAVGDVNGSATFTATLAKAQFVNDGSVKVAPGAAIAVPVKADVENLSALTLKFKYSKEFGTFAGVSSKLAGLIANDVNGEVTIAWADLSAKAAFTSKNGELLTLNFKPTEAFKAGKSFSVDVNAAELVNADGKVMNAMLKGSTVDANVPSVFALNQNYPNPFNPTTTISYDLPVNAKVSLVVFNVLGQEVATLVNGVQEAGSHKVQFNAQNLTSGMYIYTLHVTNGDQKFTQTQKMILMK